MELQERALLLMKRKGEVKWEKGIGGRLILHSIRQPKESTEKRKQIPQMEVKQGFD